MNSLNLPTERITLYKREKKAVELTHEQTKARTNERKLVRTKKARTNERIQQRMDERTNKQ